MLSLPSVQDYLVYSILSLPSVQDYLVYSVLSLPSVQDYLVYSMLSLPSVQDYLVYSMLSLPSVQDYLVYSMLSLPSVQDYLVFSMLSLPSVQDYLVYSMLSLPSVQDYLVYSMLSLPSVQDYLVYSMLSLPSVQDYLVLLSLPSVYKVPGLPCILLQFRITLYLFLQVYSQDYPSCILRVISSTLRSSFSSGLPCILKEETTRCLFLPVYSMLPLPSVQCILRIRIPVYSMLSLPMELQGYPCILRVVSSFSSGCILPCIPCCLFRFTMLSLPSCCSSVQDRITCILYTPGLFLN